MGKSVEVNAQLGELAVYSWQFTVENRVSKARVFIISDAIICVGICHWQILQQERLWTANRSEWRNSQRVTLQPAIKEFLRSVVSFWMCW